MAIKNKLLVLAFGALKELGYEVWFWKGCGLCQCFASTFGIVAKFPRRKSSNISPQVRLRQQNTILTKLSWWEYDNKGAPLSLWKSSIVSRLVHHGTSAGFHGCVYGAHLYVHTKWEDGKLIGLLVWNLSFFSFFLFFFNILVTSTLVLSLCLSRQAMLVT